jgi:hypothetical protein
VTSDWLEVRGQIATNMSVEQACVVRELAATLTWRGIAVSFPYEVGPALVEESLRGNQIVGMFLVEVAAELLQEPPSGWSRD